MGFESYFPTNRSFRLMKWSSKQQPLPLEFTELIRSPNTVHHGADSLHGLSPNPHPFLLNDRVSWHTFNVFLRNKSTPSQTWRHILKKLATPMLGTYGRGRSPWCPGLKPWRNHWLPGRRSSSTFFACSRFAETLRMRRPGSKRPNPQLLPPSSVSTDGASGARGLRLFEGSGIQ